MRPPLVFGVVTLGVAGPLLAQSVAPVTFQLQYDLASRELTPAGHAAAAADGLLVGGQAFAPLSGIGRPYLMALGDRGDVVYYRELPVVTDFHAAVAVRRVAATGDALVLADLANTGEAATILVDPGGALRAAWRFAAGGGGLRMRDALPTRDRGYLMVGSVASLVTGRDILMVKVGPGGGIQWHHQIAGGIAAPLFGSDDEATGASAAADGSGYYVTGTWQSDAWLAKVDGSGQIAFQRTYRVVGATVFERALHLHEGYGDRRFLIARADFRNDRFPLVLEVDGDGVPQSVSATSINMSASSALSTADGGFAVGGSSTVGASQGARLAKYDGLGALQWAFQYDSTLTFSTVNPPAHVTTRAGGGYLISIPARAGLEPVQEVVAVAADGQLNCGATPLGAPFSFDVDSVAVMPALAQRDLTVRPIDLVAVPGAVTETTLCAPR